MNLPAFHLHKHPVTGDYRATADGPLALSVPIGPEEALAPEHREAITEHLHAAIRDSLAPHKHADAMNLLAAYITRDLMEAIDSRDA